MQTISGPLVSFLTAASNNVNTRELQFNAITGSDSSVLAGGVIPRNKAYPSFNLESPGDVYGRDWDQRQFRSLESEKIKSNQSGIIFIPFSL